MPTEMVRQTQFTTGQVDEVNWKRTDFPDYLTAAQTLMNVEVSTTGLGKKRKGTKFLINMTAYVTNNTQLYELQDTNGGYYILASTDNGFNIFLIDPVTEAVSHYQTISGTPYSGVQLPQIDYANDNDVIILTHPLFPPARIYVVSYGPVVFAYQVLPIYPAPAFDFGNINYNNFAVTATQTGDVLTFQFTGLAGDPGFNSEWVGGQIIGAGATIDAPVGYGIITDVAYAGGVTTFHATVLIPFASPGATSGSQYSVRQPAFSALLGYPVAVLFYQNRLWFGNTKTLNNTIFGSKINAPLNFDVGTGRDTDAIIYTIGQTNSGGILWLNGGKQLEIYCQNFEFAAPQQENIGLTPSTFSIRQQSAYGASSELKPITYINDSYYIAKTGQAIINYHFNGIGQTYTSSNISVASQNLVKNPINRGLLRGTDTSQDNFIYFLNPDSTITCFQFAAEYKLAALTPIVFSNVINPVNVVDNVAIKNEIYFLKNYPLTGNYSLEKFIPDFKIDGYIELNMPVSGEILGLDQFNGYVVQVVFQNQDFGEYLVQNGQIPVFNPTGLSGTAQIGLLYFYQITPMYIFAGANQSNYNKEITRIFVDYYKSLNFYVNGTLVNYQNFADIQAGLPLQLQTGTIEIDVVDGSKRFSTLTITQNSPFDCNILAIAYQVSASIV